jgi:hypothetical protein
MVANSLENYLALLEIRRATSRRDTTLIGAVFIISFIAMIALAMLDRLSGRSLVFVSALVVVFGLAYLTAWVKFQIIKGSIELIENLPPIGQVDR